MFWIPVPVPAALCTGLWGCTSGMGFGSVGWLWLQVRALAVGVFLIFCQNQPGEGGLELKESCM